jgi:hypothetical protein
VLIGDRIAEALARLGINDDIISVWVGAPCGCRERQEKLNALDLWARRILAGKIDRAKEFLTHILEST